MAGSPIRPICQPICRPIVRSINSLVGQSASLPAGAIGVYYADNYTTSPRPYIPNSAAAVPVAPKNLLAGTRRAFTTATVGANYAWFSSNCTLTDNAATGPDGLNEATTMVASTSGWQINRTVKNLSAGNYTLAVYAKRNTGSDQVFKFQAGAASTQMTATSTWQRFSYTFNKAVTGNQQFFLINDATTANIQFCDFELYAGTSDIGPEPAPVGNLLIGLDPYSNTGTYSGGVLDMSADDSQGLIQFPSTINAASGWTVVTLAKKVSASTGFVSALSAGDTYQNMSAYLEKSNGPGFDYNTTGTYQENYPNYWRFSGLGWHTFSHRYDLAERSIWLDGGRVFYQAAVVGQPTLRDFKFSTIINDQYGNGWQYHAVAVFNRSLSDAEILQAESALKARALRYSISQGSIRFYAALGDSITSSANYPSIYAGNANPPCIGGVYSAPGSSVTSLITLLPQILRIKPAVVVSGSKYIASILVTNNINATAPSTYLSDLAGVCDSLRANGWKVVLLTIPPRTDASHNTNRAVINPELRLWLTGGSIIPGVHADGIADIAANTTIGDDADAADLMYYSDGVHPTAAGQVIIESIVRPVIDAL